MKKAAWFLFHDEAWVANPLMLSPAWMPLDFLHFPDDPSPSLMSFTVRGIRPERTQFTSLAGTSYVGLWESDDFQRWGNTLFMTS